MPATTGANPNAAVSVVIVHRVPDEHTEQFLTWKKSIDGAAKDHPGCESVELHPPVPGVQDNWVSILVFKNNEMLDSWMNSPEHSQWMKQFQSSLPHAEEVSMHQVSGGFSGWFLHDGDKAPPGWKMALAVLFGLYPTVMFLALGVSPLLKSLSLPVSMVISLAMSVAILQWCVMPLVTYVLRNWLKPTRQIPTSRTILGLAAILVLLALMVVGFSQIQW